MQGEQTNISLGGSYADTYDTEFGWTRKDYETARDLERKTRETDVNVHTEPKQLQTFIWKEKMGEMIKACAQELGIDLSEYSVSFKYKDGHKPGSSSTTTYVTRLLKNGRPLIVSCERISYIPAEDDEYPSDVEKKTRVLGEDKLANEVFSLEAALKKLDSQRVDFCDCQWERSCSWEYDAVKSFSDVERLINADSANTKIFALMYIVPVVSSFLNPERKQRLAGLLRGDLDDGRMCEIGYSGLYADEEDTTTVASAARYALDALNCGR